MAKKRRSTTWVWVTAALLFAAVMAGSYFYSRSSEESDNSPVAGQTGSGGDLVFKPIATTRLAFEASLKDTSGAGLGVNLENDGKGKTKLSGTESGQPYELYITENEYIYCLAGRCFRVDADAIPLPIDRSQYDYTEENLKLLQDLAVYAGQQQCPAGSCAVWNITEEGLETKIFVSSNNLISQITTKAENGQATIVYNYRPVLITLPENIEELDSP